MPEGGELHERTLFELFVYTEWKQEQDNLKHEKTTSQLPSSLFGYFKSNIEWPSKAFYNHIYLQLPWQISLSHDGTLVAILQDSTLEIRTAKDEFMVAVGRTGVRKDSLPQLRKMCWSPDNLMIAVGFSHGVVDIYDVYSNHLCKFPSPEEKFSQLSSKKVGARFFIAGLEFISKQHSKQEWDLELIVVYSDGTINSYQMVSFEKCPLNHRASLERSEVSCAVYSHRHNLIFIATEPEFASKMYKNTSLAAGLSAWSKINESPYYRQVFPTEDELKLFKTSNKRLWTYFQTYKNIETAVKLKISQTDRYLASLHPCGTICIWSIPGLRLYQKWSPMDLNINHPVSWDSSFSIPIDVEWHTEEEIIVSRKDGTILIHKINDFDVVFGSQQDPSNGHPRLSAIPSFPGFLALECELISLPVTPQESAQEDVDGSIVNSSSDLLQSTIYMLTDLEKYQPRKKATKNVQNIYRLLGVKNTTPEELFYRKLSNNEFDQALLLALEYGINQDIVYQEQWKTSFVSANSIELYLDKVTDKQWVLNECLNRVAETLEGASALLDYGFKLTKFEDVFKVQSEQIELSLEALKSAKGLTEYEKQAVSARITICGYEDKLNTYKMIIGKSEAEDNYNCNEFEIFRKQTYVDSAINFARAGNGSAVEILMNFHCDEIRPFWLIILNNFPETINPSMYSNILPQCDGEGNPIIRNKTVSQKHDWTSHEFFRDFHEPVNLNVLAQRLGEPCLSFSGKVFTEWYIFRALHIEELCQIVDNAIQLLVLGKQRNIQGLDDLHSNMTTLEALVYDLEIDISYKEFSQLSSLEKATLFMKNTSDAIFVPKMIKYVFPFFERIEHKFPGEKLNLLSSFIIHTSQTSLQSSINFFYYIIEGNLKILGTPEELIDLLTDCLYKYEEADKFSESLELLDNIIEWASRLSAHSSKEKILSRLSELRNEVFAAEKLHQYHISLPLEEIHNIKNDEESIKNIIEQMAESSRDGWHELLHEELQTYFQHALMLQSIIFNALPVEMFYEVYIRALLNSGIPTCIELASTVLCCRHDNEHEKNISYERSVQLVLESAKKYFNSALQYNDSNMSLARSCLYIIKDENEAIKEELDLIRALRYLYDLKIDLIPLQVRESEDKFKWIHRAIYKNKKIYKNPQPIYKLAAALKLFGDDRLKRQIVITTLLAEVSFENNDFVYCSEFCFDLIKWNSSAGWKICLHLGQCEKYTAVAEKLELLLFASIHCPSSYLQEIIKARKTLLLEAVTGTPKLPGNKPNQPECDIQIEENDGVYLLNSVDKCYSFFLNHYDKCKLHKPLHFKFKSNEINRNLMHTNYLFYSMLHKTCLPDSCTPQTEFHLPNNSAEMAKKMPLSLLMDLNGYNQDHLLKEVIIGCSLKYITESTLLSLGYLLSLLDPEDSEEFFMNIPESPFTFQLAIYFYSLSSLSYMGDHPVLSTPQEVVTWVNSQDSKDIKYIDLITKHRTRYANYKQAQQVVNLQCGVNSERFMNDADYRRDTILGLAMSCDKLSLAINLAIENNLPVAEVAVTHISSLIFENDEDSLSISLNNEKFSSILKMESDVIRQRLISLLPSMDGFNYQKLMMLFSVLKELDNHYPIHSLTPSEHIDLLAKIADLLPDLDYRDLIENHSRLLEALKESLNYNENDFLKLIKALKKIITTDIYNFNDSDIFLELVIQEFKEKCLSKKSSLNWMSQYEKIFPYLSKIDSSQLKTFVDETVCSKEAALALESKDRIDALNLLLEWCIEANVVRENMDDILEAVCGKINNLKKIWDYNTTGVSSTVNSSNMKKYFALLEHSKNEETNMELLIDCILCPSVSKEEIKKFYKISGIALPLEFIICSLPKKHPTKFDIIMRRILEIGAENPESNSFSANDWEEEEIEFSDKEIFPSESFSEEDSCSYDYGLAETEKSDSLEDNKCSTDKTKLKIDFSTLSTDLKKSTDPKEMLELYTSFVSSDISDEERTDGILLLLKSLLPLASFMKYQCCKEIITPPLNSERLTEFVMENYNNDFIFTIWICLCSDIPHLISFSEELLQNIEVSHMKLYFQSVNNDSTQLLTTHLVESLKFGEMLNEMDASDPSFNFKTLTKVLFESGFITEAKFLRMKKADNIPESLISFHSTLE
ncbi:neuroblastoma-amplified sequence-like [Cimex lectularius]|uniref:Neuroblastoma-amplified sequence N-terminal domain-containing protein n=1 Tax=Cimex lectularius TaxID=79782 RepID=A0A8I6RJD4_CIMLE|nr:neuroblastoma-amplified sequence-like [Cimex lectularius]